MDHQKKISDKDLKLIVYFCSFLILTAAFYFGYMKMNQEKLDLESKIPPLQVELTTLKSKVAKKKQYEDEILTMTKGMDEITKKFPSTMKPERYIMFLTKMEDYKGISISNITFSENKLFYPLLSSESVDESEAETTKEEEEISTFEDISGSSEQESNENEEGKSILAFKSTVKIDFTTTYNGLKECINYINNADLKMNIGDVSVAYDSSTGNLSGNMTIEVYTVAGAGILDDEITVDGIKTGRDNIFGTFETPNE